MTDAESAKMPGDAMSGEMVQLRRVDFERISRRSEDALAIRRESIMARLVAGSFAAGQPLQGKEDMANLRYIADAIMEAAK